MLGSVRKGRHKKHQSYGSQIGSMSQVSINCNTVIVRETPLDTLSSVLYRKSSQKQPLKKQALTLKHDPYQRARLQQQMRGYELRTELEVVKKDTRNTALKQKILEGLLIRCENDIDNSF